jgi:hypothetical protein
MFELCFCNEYIEGLDASNRRCVSNMMCLLLVIQWHQLVIKTAMRVKRVSDYFIMGDT